MSLRPLTTGVSAGSSLALALKLLDWDHHKLLDLYRETDLPRFDSGSFLCGLICGLILFALIEWLVTLRWCLLQWVEGLRAHQEQASTPRKKELYKLL